MKVLKAVVQELLIRGEDDSDIILEVRKAIDELIGSVPIGEQPRFNYQKCEDSINIKNIKTTFKIGGLMGIVDESKGGFIGYAIGEEHAKLITQALTSQKGVFWEISK